MKRTIFDAEHEMFRESFRQFLDKEVVPYHLQWERDGIVPRELFYAAGKLGFLGMDVPTQYGGGGEPDFRYNYVIHEEVQAAGVNASGLGMSLHNDTGIAYLLHCANEEQRERWLPGVVTGDLITAIAMTEPGTGSDLGAVRATAIRDGEHYVLNGSKTFITNGINADIVIVVAKTDPSKRTGGLSLIVVERSQVGFTRGRRLEKIGMHAQDTAELFFENARVPAANLLGEEGAGFHYLTQNLPQERLAIATISVAAARAALELTLEYTKERTAFGQKVGSFQNSRFSLAEMHSEILIATTFVDKCVLAHNAGELSAEEAAVAKWWCSDLQNRVVDRCLQLHGGYGYMSEYPIARAFVDARVQRIYGGTNEIMKEIIGRSLGV
ncbi:MULTISPECIES: acyl-CoA dehydrogenase family protein [Rhodococcus]|jgi:alkylation response protein AidB-like acyl-CoA dehydrogenase|uniref:Acyl-[acyl-carrier-protein] dehydrogenase MbtN n=1 Tax=Rhodococcus oxybenzonivorans TaxID=1990687 RepID=A0A2S2C6F4_9NOCA|nr:MULTISPECIES: acyl-CoA dehydrogenase family protein [Rhodococcus]AWK76481.1 acyl-CoA dehydrogenase [Rhodococcus oxybenzonivorans]